MRITRYFIHEITAPFLVGTTLLVVIFAGYTAATFLSDMADNVLPPGTIAYLIFLRLLTVIDVILPSALFFSIIFGIGRLYRDSEIIALMAVGFSEWQLLRSVSYLALIVALLASLAANVGRPWAFRINYALRAKAMTELDIARIRPGHFVHLRRSNQVLLARSVDSVKARLHDVYMETDRGSGTNQVITARSLMLPKSGAANIVPVTFGKGYVYLLDDRGGKDRRIEFETLRLPLPGGVAPVPYKRKAANTRDLARSDNAGAIAELQWRLAAPLTTILLALLGVPLSRMSPRRRRHSGMILAIIVYAVLFNLFGVARSLVEQSRVPAIPGIWWFYVLPLILLWVLMVPPVPFLQMHRR